MGDLLLCCAELRDEPLVILYVWKILCVSVLLLINSQILVYGCVLSVAVSLRKKHKSIFASVQELLWDVG